jgi:ATP-dependent Clp protease adaptor protein ClpS
MNSVSKDFAEAVRQAFMGSFGVELPDTETLMAEAVDVMLPSKVILYNDEEHTFDEVINQLMKATGCSSGRAEELAFEVDSRGLACVYEGDMGECLQVSSILESIALHTQIEF